MLSEQQREQFKSIVKINSLGLNVSITLLSECPIVVGEVVRIDGFDSDLFVRRSHGFTERHNGYDYRLEPVGHTRKYSVKFKGRYRREDDFNSGELNCFNMSAYLRFISDTNNKL